MVSLSRRTSLRWLCCKNGPANRQYLGCWFFKLGARQCFAQSNMAVAPVSMRDRSPAFRANLYLRQAVAGLRVRMPSIRQYGNAVKVKATVVHGLRGRWPESLPWLAGLLSAPLWCLLIVAFPVSRSSAWAFALAASAFTPIPGLIILQRRNARAAARAAQAREEAGRLKFELDSIRFRAARLREDLSAADRQARLSHHLSILGQFTAGFMHEFNNPLSIVTSRIEVLLEERKDDESLCADLQQMLREARYMANISRTLLQALRRERGAEGFDPSVPWKAMRGRCPGTNIICG